ncbi:MAG: cell division protein ZapA [Prevotellaceae bacterium]|jgi:cell division protein ZapA|nr:cell division protein ZapA [Prevotellaceae bacterium]
MDKFSIRVNIAERYYPLRIERNDEEKVRRAVKLINEKVLTCKQRHADKDAQDWLAMVCVSFAMKEMTENEQKIPLSKAVDALQDLDKKLTEYLDYATGK